MSEWISVKERLPPARDKVLVVGPKGYDVGYQLSARRGWNALLDEYTHWMPLPPPPEPKLTVKEALREAIAAIQEAWGISLVMQSEKGDFGRLIDLADEMYEMKFKELLPRLRSVLESEE